MWKSKLILFGLSTFLSCNSAPKQSFTVSCGSGCAMTYDEVSTEIASSPRIIKFKVTMYVNEAVTDDYFETYEIVCRESGIPNSVRLQGDKKNLLKDKESLLKNDLERIARNTCSKK